MDMSTDMFIQLWIYRFGHNDTVMSPVTWVVIMGLFEIVNYLFQWIIKIMEYKLPLLLYYSVVCFCIL